MSDEELLKMAEYGLKKITYPFMESLAPHEVVDVSKAASLLVIARNSVHPKHQSHGIGGAANSQNIDDAIRCSTCGVKINLNGKTLHNIQKHRDMGDFVTESKV